MSGLFGSGSAPSITAQTGVTVSTSCYGNPIPLVWGLTRLPVNLIWYGDFVAQEQHAAGKGGSGPVTGYTYSAALQMGICEGPVNFPSGTVWSGKDVHTLSALGLVYASPSAGAPDQNPWAYYNSNHPDQSLNYPGIAWVACPSYSLGSAAEVPNLNIEVQGPYSTENSDQDASPADVLLDFLGNVQYGANYDASSVQGVDDYRAYCAAQQLWVSPAWKELRAANEYVKQLLAITNTEVMTSQGAMKLVPYQDGDFVFAISVDELLAPVKRTSLNNDDAFNVLKLSCRDRSIGYNTTTIEMQDQVSIANFGRREASQIDAPEFCDAAAGARSAQLQLQRMLYVRQRFEVQVGLQRTLYEPMDVGTIPYRGRTVPVRILSVDRSADDVFTWKCEEYVPGIGDVLSIPTQTGTGWATNQNSAPGPMYDPLFMNAPKWLVNGQCQLWMAVSGGANWGGAQVWASQDGTTYKKIGTIAGNAKYGALTTSLPSAGADPDVVNTLAVQLANPANQLASVADAAAQKDLSICWVGGELLNFVSATLVGPGQYYLTKLYRGRKSTNMGSHAAGTGFALLDHNIFRYTYEPSLAGSTVYLKFCSFNAFGGAVQDISTVAAHTVTLSPVTSGGATASYIANFEN